ncbi:hypothetical protein [Cyclobacterium marinum]|uniref:Uncharacterized protein n=1 Tax=Cyclobacterium marinum (strain ATCC 25205 / DSM 745 / LMG 13164 / NCIMB 1802) TaxID=880070 RepID=G0IY12_CYCMS|nr:hypothetical protein [Cyclobacterium marinum]AEL24345.1 hypothetical protein Cycma_0570 [Cyclobacterium marinum DSM 745]
MSYTSILQQLQGRLIDDSTTFYTQRNIEIPNDVIPWETVNFDEDNDTQPPRPYIGVDFSDMPLDYFEGKKTGFTEFKIMVVVDNFHRGRIESEDKVDYLEKLAYADHVDELLDMYGGYRITGFDKPIFSGNLIIRGLRVRKEIKFQRNRTAWMPG